MEYDKSASDAGLKKGNRVLVLGAGSVPHHIRWKNKLGSEGDIVALDIDRFVIKKSYHMEQTIEWIYSLFGKHRWISKHICADASEIPFPSRCFDAVIAVRCYHVNCAEALRVLKPGGKLVISNSCGDVHNLDKNKIQIENTLCGHVITV